MIILYTNNINVGNDLGVYGCNNDVPLASSDNNDYYYYFFKLKTDKIKHNFEIPTVPIFVRLQRV